MREWDLKRQYGSRHDPERPPQWEPGDEYIVFGLVAGIVIGGVLGLLLSLYLDFVGIEVSLPIGLIAGGFIGTMAGDKIKKYVANKRHKTKN